MEKRKNTNGKCVHIDKAGETQILSAPRYTGFVSLALTLLIMCPCMDLPHPEVWISLVSAQETPTIEGFL